VTTNYIILVGDKDFTSKYARFLSSCTNKNAKPYIDRNKNIYFVRSNNFMLYSLFEKTRNNTKYLVELLVENSMRANLLFVEGFFDAEGCVKIINDKARFVPKVCLDITNTKLTYLDIVKRILKNY